MTSIILRSDAQRKTALDLIGKLDLSKPFEVTVKRYVQKRSLNQSALYWKWIHLIANDTGNDPDDVHEAMKTKYLPPIERLGSMIRPSTTKLSTVEMSAYMDRVYAFATSELGLILPVPEAMHQSAA